MPRLGSLTQAPGRAFSRQMGANQWPMADHGVVRYAWFNGHAEVDIDLGQNVQLGHFARAPIRLAKPLFYGTFTIAGITRDSSGAALAACQVDLFKTSAFEELVATTTSDGSGAFSFTLGQNAGTFFLRAYKTGSPDVTGGSVNTLAAI